MQQYPRLRGEWYTSGIDISPDRGSDRACDLDRRHTSAYRRAAVRTGARTDRGTGAAGYLWRRALHFQYEDHEINADYNLILIDWKMPDMDGIETARRIRKIVGPEVTIIILTAYDWSEIEQQARLAGVNTISCLTFLPGELFLDSP